MEHFHQYNKNKSFHRKFNVKFGFGRVMYDGVTEGVVCLETCYRSIHVKAVIQNGRVSCDIKRCASRCPIKLILPLAIPSKYRPLSFLIVTDPVHIPTPQPGLRHFALQSITPRRTKMDVWEEHCDGVVHKIEKFNPRYRLIAMPCSQEWMCPCFDNDFIRYLRIDYISTSLGMLISHSSPVKCARLK